MREAFQAEGTMYLLHTMKCASNQKQSELLKYTVPGMVSKRWGLEGLLKKIEALFYSLLGSYLRIESHGLFIYLSEPTL